MKIVIDIPEETYKGIMLGKWFGNSLAFYIQEGTLLSEDCDCVSRKAVHDMLENVPINPEDKWFNWLQKACLRLADLPPATPPDSEDHVHCMYSPEEVAESFMRSVAAVEAQLDNNKE